MTLELHSYCAKALMDNIKGLSCQIQKGHSQKKIPSKYRHCFADRCKLKRGQQCDSACLIELSLYATPILHYVCSMHMVFGQKNCGIISVKSLKTTIRENLDPQKFSAIWYTLSCRSGFAPAPRRSSTTLWWPLKLAVLSAVWPSCMAKSVIVTTCNSYRIIIWIQYT